MLFLNHELLTSERIQSFFKRIEHLAPASSSSAPSPLSQLKTKLKANFFPDLTGCDLVLTCVPPGDIDLNQLEKKTPTLIKQGDQYFLYGRTDNKTWTLTSLDRHTVAQENLNFSSERTLLPYSHQHQSLYSHIVSKNNQINMNKRPADETMKTIIAADMRFKSNYLKLKQVLTTIFALTDTSEKAVALEQLNAIQGTDWDTTMASTQFAELNKTYGYFDDISPVLSSLFTELAIACRTMIVLFEKNNTQDDKMAYDYAYKLMALFIDPNHVVDVKTSLDLIAKEANNLITRNDSDKGHPFHDALLVKLKLPKSCELDDKAGWRKFIKEAGVKSFPILNMAEKINTKLGRAPKDLTEANAIASTCAYNRAEEDPDFAKICYDYKVPEARFNHGLDFMSTGWPKKRNDADSIPNITIEGTGESTGLYWVKLPASDKRALILGSITDCCQSIGDHSGQCVEDAVSLSDNGLYVLVKPHKKKVADLIVNGAINDTDFKIIGESYVWKSATGNICLDSIECLKGEVPDAAIKGIISDFATKLLHDNPDVHTVTVGRGGKTPPNLFAKAPIAETMRQGFAYGDASSQYCIAKSPHHALMEPQREALDTLLKPYSESFKQCIDYLSDYLTDSEHLIENVKNLLNQVPSLETELTPESLSKLLYLNPCPSTADLMPVDFKALEQLNTEDRTAALTAISTARLAWRVTVFDDAGDTLLRMMSYLPERDRLAVAEWQESRFHYTFSALDYMSNSPPKFAALMNLIPADQRIHALMVKNSSGKTVFETAFSNQENWPMLLTMMPKEQLPAVLNENILYHVVNRYPDCFSSIINLYPHDLLIKMLLENHQHDQGITLLHQAAKNLVCLTELLTIYPQPQLFNAVMIRNWSQESVLQTAARFNGSLGLILNALPPDKRLEAVMAPCSRGSTLLWHAARDPDNLAAVLAIYPPEKRLDALMLETHSYSYPNTPLHGAAANPACLMSILKALPEHQSVALVQKYPDYFKAPELGEYIHTVTCEHNKQSTKDMKSRLREQRTTIELQKESEESETENIIKPSGLTS